MERNDKSAQGPLSLEIDVSRKETNTRNLINNVLSSKHGGVLNHGFVFQFRTRNTNYSANEFYIKDISKLNVLSSEEDQNVEIVTLNSGIRVKYFYKMLHFHMNNKSCFEIRGIELCKSFRTNYGMKRLIRNAHFLKELDIIEVTMTSKHFSSVLLCGVYLERLVLQKCKVSGPKLTFTANSSSCLRNIFIKWGYRITPPDVVKNAPDYLDNFLWHINQCPCSETLDKVTIQGSLVDRESKAIIKEEYQNLSFRFTIY
ncbi:unnamed protein product [Moneuplotes crassus]|uniref:Uncharacterized protein n=1 Tax=Euplotes crassus TaxID=5936 RepID=A0AAD1XC06_EUPCR|nr:unnamed protein product [Moneuplotes crassus]